MQLPRAMAQKEIEEVLVQLPGWTLHYTDDQSHLFKRLAFQDFRGAMRFMQACVEEIDRFDHHPVWTNKYNTIDIHLDTYDIGHKVSPFDITLARYFESILQERGEEFGYKPTI